MFWNALGLQGKKGALGVHRTTTPHSASSHKRTGLKTPRPIHPANWNPPTSSPRPSRQDGLLRRVHLDLIGSSSTPGEVRRAADQRPNAYEHIVERLLASPRYGERWDAIGWTPPVMPIAMVTAVLRNVAVPRLGHPRHQR